MGAKIITAQPPWWQRENVVDAVARRLVEEAGFVSNIEGNVPAYREQARELLRIANEAKKTAP